MAAPVPARGTPRPAFAGALAVAALAASASAAQNMVPLRTMATLLGTCERLVVAGADRSTACHGALGNLTYANGRSSFLFSDSEAGMAISFSGLDEARAGEVVTLTLDLITRASGPEPVVTPEPATGACEFQSLCRPLLRALRRDHRLGPVRRRLHQQWRAAADHPALIRPHPALG